MQVVLRICTLVLFAALATSAQSVTGSYRGGLISPPLPKPAFTLTDTSGEPFDFVQKTRGYVTLLFFGYTYCPDQCPMHMGALSSALKKLPPSVADHIRLVFVTTDPERDSLATLRRWLDHFDKRFIGLSGNPRAIEAVQREAGVPVAVKSGASATYQVAHANFVIAYTMDEMAHVLYPGGVAKDDWIHDLPLLLHETWGRESYRPVLSPPASQSR